MKLIADFITTEEQAGLVIYKLTRKAQVAQGPFVFEYEELEHTPNEWYRIAAKFPHLHTIKGGNWLSGKNHTRRTTAKPGKAVHLRVFKDTDAN